MMGDLNTVPKGAQTCKFRNGDDDNYEGDRTLEILQEAGLKVYPRGKEKEFFTYPSASKAGGQDLSNRTLDYILVSNHWDVLQYEVVKDLCLSDHCPVIAKLRLRS